MHSTLGWAKAQAAAGCAMLGLPGGLEGGLVLVTPCARHKGHELRPVVSHCGI